eukprot:s812_g7.t1
MDTRRRARRRPPLFRTAQRLCQGSWLLPNVLARRSFSTEDGPGPRALSEALQEAGLQPKAPPCFWHRLSRAAGFAIDRHLAPSAPLSEPMVAQTVSKLLAPGGRLLISSSMPIRDLDFFAKPSADPLQAPLQPPAANRGASGIDGVISTAVGVCLGSQAPGTLVIGDVASLVDLNALQQLAGPEAPALTIVLVNNGGGGIFSFLPIGKHTDVLSPFFSEPHATDFEDVSRAFGLPYTLCCSLEDLEAAYALSQNQPPSSGPSIIEVRPAHSFEDC